MIEARVTRIHVGEQGEAIFHEGSFSVSIEDHAAGEFVVVEEMGSTNLKPGVIAIDPTQWPTLRKTIDKMLKECRA